MSDSKEFIEYIVKSVVDNPDEVRIKEISGEQTVVYEVQVGKRDMGKVLDKIESEEGHRIFSKYLSEFAESIGGTIDGFDGSLIYAGGDDVLAYVPLHTVIECADAIRQKFAASMTNIFFTTAPNSMPIVVRNFFSSTEKE